MPIKSEYITGFAVGVGVSALGYYAYKKNQEKIDDFLRQQGIQVPSHGTSKNRSTMTLEELVLEKENIEDLIAEKEMAANDSLVSDQAK
ncbi:MAG: hypothetical protein N4A57_13805 [Anaeromicrobium sp.]|jgi:hypothetical protein|uniref:hypothetical protein n=1 Tax=Anaeromicrobium sp. TaxID=1929132 RepID=UPI0025F4FBA1|nr:hypothetical protein [Anaeromicrobium sp.]MCT4595320.1 hypothetical protein [Anaeromicrobium sp.]